MQNNDTALRDRAQEPVTGSRATRTLVGAVITSGMTAGLFGAFSYAVMPALRRSDDRSFIEIMQNVNEVILNPVFLAFFLGGLGFGIAATAAHRHSPDKVLRRWVIAGLVCYLAMLLITVVLHVPLNYDLAEAGDPDKIENAHAVREAFEDDWVVANILRSVANLASFACFTWALVLSVRSRTSATSPTSPTSPADGRTSV